MIFEIGPEDVGARLDVFLSHVVPGVSRSQLRLMNRSDRIRVNDSEVKSGYRLRIGDRIEMEAPGPVSRRPEAEAIPLVVLHEDPHLIVVEKPAGMVVHPGAGNPRGTMVNALLARFGDLPDLGGPERPGIVHRLDKLTSGLIIVARTAESHRRLSASFEQREVEKRYLGLAHGALRDDEGHIDLAIGRHRSIRTRMAADSRRGREASTRYRVIDRAPGFSMLEIEIQTGRTHQIRVHLSAVGHPIVGDATYGQRLHAAFVRRHGDPGRYFLHAASIRFPHPATGEVTAFESRLPTDLTALWDRLKAGR